VDLRGWTVYIGMVLERLKRHDLTDEEWERLRPLLPAHPRQGGRWADHRTVMRHRRPRATLVTGPSRHARNCGHPSGLRWSFLGQTSVLLPELNAADLHIRSSRRVAGRRRPLCVRASPVPRGTTHGRRGRSGYTDRPAGFLPLTRDLRQSVCCRRLPRRSVGPTVDAVALVKAEVSRADVITMGIGPAGLMLVGELCPAGMRL
jgi:hypothetical protein